MSAGAYLGVLSCRLGVVVFSHMRQPGAANCFKRVCLKLCAIVEGFGSGFLASLVLPIVTVGLLVTRTHMSYSLNSLKGVI